MLQKALLFSSLSLLTSISAQQVGTYTAESHPTLTFQTCTAPGSCTTQNAGVTLDANWRWVHETTSTTNCYTGNSWSSTICPTSGTTPGLACAQKCALDGADYSGTYGITTSGNALTLKFVTGSNVGSRVYLLAPGSDSQYYMVKPKAKEFTFDVDVSKLPCGLNGALYFSQMDADGGMAKYSSNKAGAKYGTGYCDSQCPHDIKFINGEANIEGWNASSNNGNTGTGRYGTCCNEMDIWEANSISTAYTPHGCTVNGPYRCESTECGDNDRYGGVCDKDGCDFNSYRNGEKEFYGPGKTVNTNQKFTVVTQFITSDGTATGALTEIRRLYVQNGVVIQNTKVNVPGVSPYDSITTDYCADIKAAFGDTNDFAAKGGFSPMDRALSEGMVLVLSVWDDYAVNMLWLDSDYPLDKDPSVPGVSRGTCPTTSGVPAEVEAQHPDAQVIYSNIKIGPIGSTYTGSTSSSSNSPSSASSSRASSSSTRTSSAQQGGQTLWGQCGGQYYTGPTNCAQGTCTYSNPWYSQCLP